MKLFKIPVVIQTETFVYAQNERAARLLANQQKEEILENIHDTVFTSRDETMNATKFMPPLEITSLQDVPEDWLGCMAFGEELFVNIEDFLGYSDLWKGGRPPLPPPKHLGRRRR